jgi:hypothetical protein
MPVTTTRRFIIANGYYRGTGIFFTEKEACLFLERAGFKMKDLSGNLAHPVGGKINEKSSDFFGVGKGLKRAFLQVLLVLS